VTIAPTTTHTLAEDMRDRLGYTADLTPDESCEAVNPWRSVFYVTNDDGERFRVAVESVS
jgi:hypothetical protein